MNRLRAALPYSPSQVDTHIMTDSLATSHPGIPDAIACLTLWLKDGEHDSNEVDDFVQRYVQDGNDASRFISGLLSVAGMLVLLRSDEIDIEPVEIVRRLAIAFNTPPA